MKSTQTIDNLVVDHQSSLVEAEQRSVSAFVFQELLCGALLVCDMNTGAGCVFSSPRLYMNVGYVCTMRSGSRTCHLKETCLVFGALVHLMLKLIVKTPNTKQFHL